MSDAQAPRPDFDDFYLASRRRLVLADLRADRRPRGGPQRGRATRSWPPGTTGARSRRLPDPEEWVRPRAWAMAQRRHVARLWHREKGHQRRAEGGARRPAPPARPAAQGAAAGPPRRLRPARHRPRAGRERGRGSRTSSTAATASFCKETGRPADGVLAADRVARPRSPRRPHSPRRRRSREPAAVAGGCTPSAGSSCSLALTLLGGLFVVRGGVEKPAAAGGSRAGAEAGHRGDAARACRRCGSSRPASPWRAGRHLGQHLRHRHQHRVPGRPLRRPTWAGHASSASSPPAGKPRRARTCRPSRSRAPRQAAAAAYRTTLGWFAGCSRGAAAAAQRLPGARARRDRRRC